MRLTGRFEWCSDTPPLTPAFSRRSRYRATCRELGARGVVQLLVEGGATVAHEFHQARLVDRYVLYLAPALFGGDDAKPAFAGPAAASIGEVWRGRILSVEQLGSDLRVELAGAGE